MLLTTWKAILQELHQAQTLWLCLLFGFSYPFVKKAKGSDSRQSNWRLKLSLLGHLLLVPIAALLQIQGFEQMAHMTAFAYGLCSLFIVVTILTRFLYFYFLPRLGIRPPLIAHDLFMITAGLFGFFGLAAQAGLNIAGVIATSAVVTAVIGLSLQDTLGNVIGGIVLQIDKSLSVGDWVKFGDISGKISEISWRFTTIETRNWETVIVPNSQLMKSQVTILGKRSHHTLLWRRWVWFHVDFRYSPTEVIELVNQSLRNADIPNVASEPALNCLLMDFDASTARYAVRYWLIDPELDDPTDSAIRVHLTYALNRARIPISVPSQTLFLNQGDPAAWGQASDKELLARRRFVAEMPLLQGLTSQEQDELAEKLISVAFLAGELITRQGAEGHWLYILAQGRVSVRLRNPDGEDVEVNQLDAVCFFGEMSLLTGSPRSTSVVALTDVKCYRLDKGSFQDVIRQRPEIAESIAEVLVERKAQTAEISHQLQDLSRHIQDEKVSILQSIKAFLHLD